MPESIIVSPFSITYDGNDAEQHIISAQQLGESIIGASRLYTSIAHYCMFGVVPRGNYKKAFQCFAKPAQENCYEVQVFIAAITSEYSLHHEIYNEAFGFLFSIFTDKIKEMWTRPGEKENIIKILSDNMLEQAQINASVNTVLANGLVHSNENLASLHGKLIETLPQLADATRANGKMLVSPVGNTCQKMTQFTNTNKAIVITEAEADVIRGTDEMEVDEMQKYQCKRIREVNDLNGHCILEVEGFDEFVVGKISDPALAMPNNVYTKSHNDHTSFTFSAKPVKKNGVIQKLYINDASENV